jgi:hypothetical protein
MELYNTWLVVSDSSNFFFNWHVQMARSKRFHHDISMYVNNVLWSYPLPPLFFLILPPFSPFSLPLLSLQ